MSTMLKTSVAAALLVASAFGASAQTSGTTTKGQQMSQAECQSLWNTADSSKGGSLTQTQAQTYVSDFKSADKNNDGKLSSTEFMDACQRGLVHGSASTGSSTGTGGSTSTGTKSGTSK